MARIYKLSDKIKYNVGDISFEISPLNVHDKATLHSFMAKGQEGDLNSLMLGSAEAIKMGIKSITGIENEDGSPYMLQFDSNNRLTDECVADLMNLKECNQLITLCASLISGIPDVLPMGVSLAEGNKSPNVKAKK